MGKRKKQSLVNRLIKLTVDHKVLFIIIALLFVLIIILFGAKILLYLKLLMGNDTIVRLDVNKRDIYLVHGEQADLEFEAKVTTNPFCKAFCSYTFMDITSGDIIEKDDFTLRPAVPLNRKYSVAPPEMGTGLALYRFDMECYSVKTVLCHTKGDPSTRSILITLNYDLNEEEKRLKEKLGERTKELIKKISDLQGMQDTFEEISLELNKSLVFEDETNHTQTYILKLTSNLLDLRNLWNREDYYALSNEIKESEAFLPEVDLLFSDVNSTLLSLVGSYNKIIEELTIERGELQKLKIQVITNTSMELEIKEVISEFNSMLEAFNEKGTLSHKNTLQHQLVKRIIDLKIRVEDHIKKEDLRKELETNINYDLLCKLDNQCITHSSIAYLADKPSFNLSKVCSEREELVEVLRSVNESVNDQFVAQNYPSNDEFWQNIRLILNNMKHNIILGYLDQIPEKSANKEIIIESLNKSSLTETQDYPEYNLTFALIHDLATQKPISCNLTNTSFPVVYETSINKIEIKEYNPLSLEVKFTDPLPKCCVFGICTSCCTEQECRNNISALPLVFLHGHAIDRATSAEYSLEGFNKIQKKLEDDGYLNAGSITLYTLKDAPQGILGMPRVPVTLRVSYYFDVLGEPENYVVIQTKSENIDTYAIRLKELLDIIKYKTGKPKVNIVAFSMGGLVTRRYLNIFGTDSVNKVILIGTPNNGTVGTISDYCPITGENLECRDMDSNSLFISKLNREPLPEIPIYNIVGTGCKMREGIGDGAVLEKNALLDGAKNFIINGTCTSIPKPLHLTLRDIDLYPAVYDSIRDALKEG